MLQAYGCWFVALTRASGALQYIIGEMRKEIIAQKVIPEGGPMPENSEVRTLLAEFEHACNNVPLPSVRAQVERINDILSRRHNIEEFESSITDLINRLQDELKYVLFLYVDQNAAHYYTDKQPFGSDISNRFPGAIDDIESASKCLGLGQGTASVLHLMRVMEVGLKALALSLNIPYAPSWEAYLRQIQSKIADKHPTKSVCWKTHEAFYRDVSGDLLTVKQACAQELCAEVGDGVR